MINKIIIAEWILNEVERSKAEKRVPRIVALESTIITHGMPPPSNYETAVSLEAIVTAQGALPATIAIINGVIRVGLNPDEIKWLALLPRESVVKCSRRDLAYVTANNLHGSTTVAAMIWIASICGIKICATGGAGGVHRDYSHSMDVSADLEELGRSEMLLVCAGVKSILDIPRTLEYLETKGVPVMGWKTNDFPAFYISKSPYKCSHRVDSAEQVARILASQIELKIGSGLVLACPSPIETNESFDDYEKYIQIALRECAEKKIIGKETTPFLLSRMAELTGGESLKKNIALIKNNTTIAAQIAVKLATIPLSSLLPPSSTLQQQQSVIKPAIIVLGGALVDVIASYHKGYDAHGNVLGTSFPGTSSFSCGGVARNISEALCRMGAENVQMITAINSNDYFGQMLLKSPPFHKGDSKDLVLFCDNGSSASYIAVNGSNNDLISAVANIDIMKNITESVVNEMYLKSFIKNINSNSNNNNDNSRSMAVVDCNAPLLSAVKFVELCVNDKIPVFWDATSIPLSFEYCKKSSTFVKNVNFIKADKQELLAIASAFDDKFNITTNTNDNSASNWKNVKELNKTNLLILDAISIIFQNFTSLNGLFITMGSVGVLTCLSKNNNVAGESVNDLNIHSDFVEIEIEKKKKGKYSVHYHEAEPISSKDIKSTNGAGDSYAASLIYSLSYESIYSGKNHYSHMIRRALQCAKISLLSTTAIPKSYL